MSKNPKKSVRIVLLAVLFFSLIGINSNFVPTSSGQSTYEEISSGVVDTVFNIAPEGSYSGGNLVYSLSNFNFATTFDLGSDPDLAAWAYDVQSQSSSAASGTLTINTSGYSLPLQYNASLPVTVQAATSGSTSMEFYYEGSLSASPGFTSDNLAVASSQNEGYYSSTTIGYEERPYEYPMYEQQIQSKGGSKLSPRNSFIRNVSFVENDKQKFKAHAVEWVNPSVGFKKFEMGIKHNGKAPKTVKNLKDHQLKVDTSAVQYDAVSGTISVKQKFHLKKVKKNASA